MIKIRKEGDYYIVEQNGEEIYRSKDNPKSLIEACQKDSYSLRKGDVVMVSTIYQPWLIYKAIIYGITQDYYWLLTKGGVCPEEISKRECNLEYTGTHYDLDAMFD